MSKDNFLRVPYIILNNKELSDGEKLTLALIYSFHNNNMEVYMSNNTFAERLGVSRTTASERITKLEKLGYIKCERDFINRKQHRKIVPLKMVGEPNRLVDKPTRLVGKPNRVSRNTEQGLVGKPGSIIYPSLLDNKLDTLLDTHIRLEDLECINEKELTPDQRGNYYQLKTYLKKQLKENEK